MSIDIKEIREIANKYSPEEIEGCITKEIETGQNVCLMGEDKERIIGELSKAEFIRNLLDKGMSLPDAIRELARRMRLIGKGS